MDLRTDSLNIKHERDLLRDAIVQAARAAGICKPNETPAGTMLLMMARELGEIAAKNKAKATPLPVRPAPANSDPFGRIPGAPVSRVARAPARASRPS